MIPGFSSTGSKRPEVLYGHLEGGPVRMTRAEGCRVWDVDGGEYLDTIMALGAVALGYGHPAVNAAAERAIKDGVIGPLAPRLEREVAERLGHVLGQESVRFLKTGAEAVAAAVRIARTHTGRDRVISCGYHGWLDWNQDAAGVPAAVQALHRAVPFNDVAALERVVAEFRPLAAIVIEPVVEEAPTPAWLAALRKVARAESAVLIFDEVKTAFRIAVGGAAERYGVQPDLMVVGKALGNGFPIAAVLGRRDLMEAATRTWISSTLATETVSLAAANAVLEVYRTEPVIARLNAAGERLWTGLIRLAAQFPNVVERVRGLPEMCYLHSSDEPTSGAIARKAADRGLLFKRSAYNYVSLAHTDPVIDAVLERLEGVLDEVERTC
ncbi:MAG TPA: aminotransferase class III-fold pyridoxal phosphate-dependent enzyme [Gemmatimonadales bacterium]|jgi:glutamate-1-semialdehyde aminotransferase